MLAGGGLKVAFQAGVLQVWLDEAGLTFDHVDGASGGVFNLAMHCQGMSGRAIADNWRTTRLIEGISLNTRRALAGEPVDVGGQHVRMPARPELVEAQVVDQDDEQVGARGGRRHPGSLAWITREH
jgi:hypothetical protein